MHVANEIEVGGGVRHAFCSGRGREAAARPFSRSFLAAFEPKETRSSSGKFCAAHFILRKIDPGLDKAGGWAVLGGPSFCVMIHVVTFLPPRMDDAAPLIFPGLPGGAN